MLDQQEELEASLRAHGKRERELIDGTTTAGTHRPQIHQRSDPTCEGRSPGGDLSALVIIVMPYDRLDHHHHSCVPLGELVPQLHLSIDIRLLTLRPFPYPDYSDYSESIAQSLSSLCRHHAG